MEKSRSFLFDAATLSVSNNCPGCAKPDLLDAGDCGPGDAPPGPVRVHELGIPNLVLDIHILAATKLIPTPLL